jgi:hypothetical protein
MELLNGRFRLPQTFAAKLHKFIGALNLLRQLIDANRSLLEFG